MVEEKRTRTWTLPVFVVLFVIVLVLYAWKEKKGWRMEL
jgi:hypothetical protein